MKKDNYFLDLADDGCWLIKRHNRSYRERVGIGNEAKKHALEKIERWNKEGKRSKPSKKELLELLNKLYTLALSSPKAWGKDWDMKDEQAYRQIVALIQKPEVTKEWIRGWAKILEDDDPEGKLLLSEVEKLLKQMLAEAGVSVA